MTIQTGEVYPTKQSGDIKVVEYINYENVVIEFINTGNQKKVQTGDIRRGNVLDREATLMRPGDRFETTKSGLLEVVEYTTHKKVLVKFLNTGNHKSTSSKAIRLGNVDDTAKPKVKLHPCYSCGETDPEKLVLFNGTNNISSLCKSCTNERNKLKRKTLHGKMLLMYNTQKRSAKKRNQELPQYTFEEFSEWLLKEGISEIYEQWVLSDYKKDLSPSVDRLDTNKSYTFDNI